MAKAITVVVPHSLGKAEALRRVHDGLEQIVTLLGDKVRVEQAPWADNSVSLSIKALGQTATARISVEDELVRVEGTVPLFLSALSSKAAKFVEQRGASLLERR